MTMESTRSETVSVKSDFRKEIREIRFLTQNTFVIRFDRDNIQFTAGQHLIVGPQGHLNQREYSIYSSEKSDYLEILVKEVLDGNVSLQLKNSRPGDLLEVNGPFGSFRLESYEKDDYDPARYIPCVSKGATSRYNGRVTAFLPDYKDEPDMLYYICGNNNMIYDVCRILRNKGVPAERIFTEVYF